MSNTDSVRYNIVSSKDFDTELRMEVKRGDISGFFVEAARNEINRRRRERAIERLRAMKPLFDDITDSAAWVRTLRAGDEERMKKLGL